MAEEIKVQLLTPMFRMVHPKLITPVKYKEKGVVKEDAVPKYSVNALFDTSVLDQFQREGDGGFNKVDITAVCKEVAKQKWGDKKLDEMFPLRGDGLRNWPLRKGEELLKVNAESDKPKDMDYVKGLVQISFSASEKFPPRLSYISNGKLVYLERNNPDDKIQIEKLFANGGSYAVAEVNVTPLVFAKNNFIKFYLNHISFRKAGERIGGGSSMMERFGGIEGGQADIDPTQGSDDSDDFEI